MKLPHSVKNIVNRPSHVRTREVMLPIVEEINHINLKLLEKIRASILGERRKIESLIANDQGQLSMFPEFDLQMEILESKADQVIEAVNEEFKSNGVRLVREKNDEGEEIIKLVRFLEKEDTQEDIGYGQR